MKALSNLELQFRTQPWPIAPLRLSSPKLSTQKPSWAQNAELTNTEDCFCLSRFPIFHLHVILGIGVRMGPLSPFWDLQLPSMFLELQISALELCAGMRWVGVHRVLHHGSRQRYSRIQSCGSNLLRFPAGRRSHGENFCARELCYHGLPPGMEQQMCRRSLHLRVHACSCS